MSSSIATIQNALSAGEFSPGLRGRNDIDKWHHATTTCRNFFSNYRGGASSRAGLAYVGTCKQQYPVPPRDIPFQFSLTQGFVLEFGEHYMRIKSNGAYVTEGGINITNIDASAIFTTTIGHGLSVGDWVYIVGSNDFNGLTWIVHSVPTSNTFTVTDLFGNVITSNTGGTTGVESRIYTVTSPYAATDLPFLKYVQSADVMTLTCVNTETQTEYPPYDLSRLGNTNWVFTQETFGSIITAPTGLSIQAFSSAVATTWYSYVVTAVSEDGEESVASLPVSIQNNDIAVFIGSNIISWPSVAGAKYYNVYSAVPAYGTTVPVSSLFGFVGTALGTSFTDTNITPDFTRVPPQHTNPFEIGEITEVNATAAGINYSQQTIGYSITTSTGSGFSGTPVVSNGGFSGFVIYNRGKNYAPGDTITITDSGGGLSTGTAHFTANPADTNSMKLGGIFIHFATAPAPAPNTGGQFIYSEIENTVALTVQTLANNLNSSNILSLSVATYVANGSDLVITYKTPGAVGDLYTMSTVSAPVTFSGANLTGGGTAGSEATATLSIGPQSHTYPSTTAYFQQRRVYANSLNNPDTYWMSRPGLYSNMDSSIPVTDSDSITGTPWAQQVNGIQFLVPMPGGLVTLTGRGAWQVNGGQQAAITPSNQNAIPQAYNGCHDIIPPIVINYDIIYVQSKGSIVRDLSYNFFTNIYTGTDITVLSSHLFTGFQISQMAYCEEPYKLVWCLRNDGTLLCLTYLKEQEVFAWTRHDTNGQFVSVCSVTELPVDALYVITQRYVQGGWRYYSERMDNRIWDTIYDSFCVDSGLSKAPVDPAIPSSLQVSGATVGSTVTCTASAAVFDNSQIGYTLFANGGTVEITGYTSPTVVTGTVVTELTETIPNDPNHMPMPVAYGDWGVFNPVSVIAGLNHLEGLTVTGLADGSVISPRVVTNGRITLDNPAGQVNIGLPYTCQIQSMYVDAPADGGTVQNKLKSINSVGVRVEGTRGIKIGTDQPDAADQQNFANIPWVKMVEVKERTQAVLPGQPIPLFTGDYFKNVDSGWDLKGQVAIQQDYPLPANILSLVFYWTLGSNG